MSDVVEKTLASIPKFLGGGFLGAGQPSSPKHASVRGFSSFLRQINKARSKHEEEHIVRHEIVEMQQKMALRDTTKQQTCDCLCRAIYCELLGYDLSSVYIHAVKLAQQGTGFEKRLGYLACSLLLNENHELILLLINTIQKDLNSSNILDNCVALTVICQLVNSEMIPSVLPLVQEKLKHPRELVRMKAAMCVHKFLLKTPSMVDHFQDQFQRILFDKDPGVMSVGVKIYSVLIQSGDRNDSKLTENLIGILSQVVSKRLPSEFEFHNVPMPWLQMDILKTLAKLGEADKQQSELMYPVLREVIQRLDMKERIAYAILYECIVTISTIYPSEELQREATTCVSRFIGSTNPSLKYIGIKALTALVKSCPESALEHQLTVVELLDDKDQAIQRKTLDLLYCMANPSNVQVVCDRLLNHLGKNTTNTFLQLDLATKVVHLADTFSTSDLWYMDTVFKVLSSCKVTLPNTLIYKVIYIIEKGCKPDRQESREFQQYLLKKSLGTLYQDNIPPQLILVSVWVLGECGHLLKNMPSEKVITLVLKHFQKQTLDVSTKLWMISSLTKLVCAKVLDRDVVTRRLAQATEVEKDSVIRQKLTDTLNIAKSQIDLNLPTMSSSHAKSPDQMDFTLSFLDDYVSRSLTEGAEPYKARTLRYQPPQPDSDLFRGLNGVIKDNTEGITKETMSQGSTVSGKLTGGSEGGSDLSGGQRETGLNMEGVKRVWGRKGLISDPQSDSAMSRSLSPQRGDNLEIPGTLAGQEDNTEDDKAKKIELASALFSGITNKQNLRVENQGGSVRTSSSPLDSRSQGSEESGSSCSLSPKPLPTTDTGGWRSLHKQSTTDTPVTETKVPENTLSASNETEGRNSHLNSKAGENSVEQNVLTGFCGGVDSSMSNLPMNVPDLNTDLTASLYAEGKHDLLSDISIMEPPHHWGQALRRDGSVPNIDDRPCLPGSTSAHSLYDVLSPENGNREFVVMETQNEKQMMDRDDSETLYDEYTDQT